MPEVGNWTAEFSTTTGTGPVVVSGSIDANHARFIDIAPAGEVYYSISDGDDREAGIGVFNGIDTITRTQVSATLRALVYNDTNPTPLNLSGSSVVSCTFNAGAYNDLINYVDTTTVALDGSRVMTGQLLTNAQQSNDANGYARKDFTESLHRITTRIETASTNLILTDERNSVSINNASATTLTIDPISTTNYPIGFQAITAQAGAGAITITAGVGVTVLGNTNTSGINDIISFYHESADIWRVAGGVI